MKKITRPDLFGLLDEMTYTADIVRAKLAVLDAVRTQLISLTHFQFVDLPAAQSRIKELVLQADLGLNSFGQMERGAGKRSAKRLK